MHLSDREVATIEDVLSRLKMVGNKPKRNQVYNLALKVSKILVKAKRREKNTLL